MLELTSLMDTQRWTLKHNNQIDFTKKLFLQLWLHNYSQVKNSCFRNLNHKREIRYWYLLRYKYLQARKALIRALSTPLFPTDMLNPFRKFKLQRSRRWSSISCLWVQMKLFTTCRPLTNSKKSQLNSTISMEQI